MTNTNDRNAVFIPSTKSVTHVVAKLLFTNWVLCAELAPTSETGIAVLSHLAELKSPAQANKRVTLAQLLTVSVNKFDVTDQEVLLANEKLMNHYNIPPF